MEDSTYTVGQVSAMTGTTVKTIHFYHRVGLLPPAATTEAGYRLYGKRDIWRLEGIRMLRHLGFSVAEIRRLLQGEVSAHRAVLWQLDAVEQRMRQLQGVRDALRAAEAHLRAEDGLDPVHRIVAAIQDGATHRLRFIEEKLREMTLAGEALVSDDWRQRMARDWRSTLPERVSPSQQETLRELQALVADPDFQSDWQAGMQAFWRFVAQSGVEPEAWNTAMRRLSERAAAAAAQGADPAGPQVQELVEQWAALFAEHLRLPLDTAFWARFTDIADRRFWGEKSRRFYALLGRLRPESAAAFRGYALLMDGVHQRVGHSTQDHPKDDTIPETERGTRP